MDVVQQNIINIGVFFSLGWVWLFFLSKIWKI